MVKSNYSAWHINRGEFSDTWPDSEKLKFFAKYAVLAPSGHNTQPWRFRLADDRLELLADAGRVLPYSGIQANEPQVSLGACLGVLEMAARGFGYKLNIEYGSKRPVLAAVSIAGRQPADASLLEAIIKRVSNRNFYDTARLPANVISGIAKADFTDVSVKNVSGKTDIKYIAELTSQATCATMGDKGFRAELSKWVRNNKTRQRDGMPGFVQGIPTPVSMLAKHVIKRIDVSKDQAKKDSGRVINSANLIIISVKNSNNNSLLDAGRQYALICIRAQQRGIASAGIGAAIIYEGTRGELIKHYKISGRPVAIIRLGKTDKAARHTPRWPLKDVLA